MSVDTTHPPGASEGHTKPSVKSRRQGKRGHRTDGTPWTHPVTVRVTAKDLSLIEKRAAKAGLPTSTYMRSAALKSRVVSTRQPAATTLSDLALIQAVSQVGTTIAKELPRVGKRHALPEQLTAAATKLNSVLEDVRSLIRSRDDVEAERQALLGRLGKIENNLNQQTRALNGINQRRLPHPKLPLQDIAATHAEIKNLLGAIAHIIGATDDE